MLHRLLSSLLSQIALSLYLFLSLPAACPSQFALSYIFSLKEKYIKRKAKQCQVPMTNRQKFSDFSGVGSGFSPDSRLSSGGGRFVTSGLHSVFQIRKHSTAQQNLYQFRNIPVCLAVRRVGVTQWCIFCVFLFVLCVFGAHFAHFLTFCAIVLI